MKLNIFFTAGFADDVSTLDIIQTLENSGVDMIEVGMPYSDPVVDGPVIQKANQMALQKGMSIPKLFEDLKGFRESVQIPVVLMGYLNPVMQYGIEKFCKDCEAIGLSGVILPDLPPHIYERDYKELFERHNLKITFIITPQTSHGRIAYLDHLSDGFIYAVSDSSVTGAEIDHSQREAYFQRLKDFNFKNECYVGFGIRERKDLDYLSQFVDGGIIGTAFINHLKENPANVLHTIPEFIKPLKDQE